MKTIKSHTKNLLLISTLRLSLLTVFSLLAFIGTSQSIDIEKNAGGNFMINISGNLANTLVAGGENLTTGLGNTLFGHNSGNDLTIEGGNVFIGQNAGANSVGYSNTYLGSSAGLGGSATGTYAGTGNVFIGYNAGYYETNSDQLYISNSLRADALIRGDFAAEELSVNGDLTVKDVLQLTRTNVDPGCSVLADAGKFWLSGQGNNIQLQVCLGASGWTDLH